MWFFCHPSISQLSVYAMDGLVFGMHAKAACGRPIDRTSPSCKTLCNQLGPRLSLALSDNLDYNGLTGALQANLKKKTCA